jgi:glutamyl-Q tRNA(Asp) synthetase
MTCRSRFAPSPTGPAHPGTLLAALLAWLDARSLKGWLSLRFEDLDPDRANQRWTDQIRFALEWLGLDWDTESHQSECLPAYENALDELASSGRLYRCNCSRSIIKRHGRPSPEGGWAYPNTCQENLIASSDWRNCTDALRLRLASEIVVVQDEDGIQLKQNPSLEMGDPIVRRRDGAFAYHLASVVDDIQFDINRIVRGRDLLPTTPTQIQIRNLLKHPQPQYKHHLLLLENRQQKLAKLHGSVGFVKIEAHMSPQQFLGSLAAIIGLQNDTIPINPQELLARFNWSAISQQDQVVRWENRTLVADHWVTP